MCKFAKIASVVVIAAGTGWISFGQPSYLHAEEAKVETKVEQTPGNDGGMRVTAEAKAPDMTDGMQQADAHAREGSRVLAKATEAALGSNAVKGISNELVAADRDRIRTGETADSSELDATVKQLNDDWKAKYGHGLSGTAVANALDPNANRAGAAGDRASVVDSSTAMPMNPEGRGAGAPRVEGTPPSGNAAGSLNLDKGSVAAAGADGTPSSPPTADGVQKQPDAPRTNQLPAQARDNANADDAQTASARMQPMAGGGEHTMYAVPGAQGSQLHLMKEGGQWKIDIDDSIDATRLNANLNRHLKMVADNKAQWPDQEADALRSGAQHVAAALTDTSATAPNP